MRRRNALRAAAAVLLMIALPAAAQRDPASLFQPKPAPESSAERVPATPERMGVTPEQFERMGFNANTMLENRPSRRSDGFTQYDTPILFPGPDRHAVAVATDTVVASASARIDERRWLLKAPIVIGLPFNFTVPAGSVFGSSIDENGESRPCMAPKPYQTFPPWTDEKREIYPLLCLRRIDGTGSYTEARLYPFYTDRAQPRALVIAPVQLDAIAAGTSHPYFGALLAARRLRIVEVQSDAATVALEMASDKRLEESGPRDPFAVLNKFRTMKTVRLPLSDGGSASLAGITLTVRRAPAGWTVEASGGFTEWATVSPDRTRVTLGEYTVGPRPR